MLPPSSTEMASGPRRATNVAPPAVDLPPLLSQTPASARMRTTPAMRQRGCRLMNARSLFEFGIGDLLPLAVVFDVKDAEVVPELQAGDGVRDERLRPLVPGVDEVILRVHLVLRLGPTEVGQKVLFLDAALGEFHTDLADFEIAFGLLERAPAVAHLEFDFIGSQLKRAAGLFIVDEGPAIDIAFRFAVERQIQYQPGVPMVAVEVWHCKPGHSYSLAVDSGGGNQVHLRLEGVGGHADLAAGVFVLFTRGLIIEPRRQCDLDRVVDADFGVEDFQSLEIRIRQDDGRVGGQAELDFEIVERLFVIADG